MWTTRSQKLKLRRRYMGNQVRFQQFWTKIRIYQTLKSFCPSSPPIKFQLPIALASVDTKDKNFKPDSDLSSNSIHWLTNKISFEMKQASFHNSYRAVWIHAPILSRLYLYSQQSESNPSIFQFWSKINCQLIPEKSRITSFEASVSEMVKMWWAFPELNLARITLKLLKYRMLSNKWI